MITDLAYQQNELSAITVANISQSFTYKVAAKINCRGCGTKLRHCHPMYNRLIICNPNSCLNYLLPPKRDTSVTSRLRAATPYPRSTLRTKKYCSFLNYGLSHYQ